MNKTLTTFFVRRVNGRWWIDGVRASPSVAMTWNDVVPAGDWAGYVELDESRNVVEILDDAGNPIDVEVNRER